MTVVHLPRRALVMLLHGYKNVISPWLPSACRFLPTCSEYGAEAITRYGALRGGILTMRRVCRCHPFARGGYDPVA